MLNASIALRVAFVGALCFWVPDVIVHIIARQNPGATAIWAITILSPSAFFASLALVARKFTARLAFDNVAVLMIVGLWLGGGLFMLLSATVAGSGFISSSLREAIILAVASILPSSTFTMSLYDGSWFALMIVTAGTLMVACVRIFRRMFSHSIRHS